MAIEQKRPEDLQSIKRISYRMKFLLRIRGFFTGIATIFKGLPLPAVANLFPPLKVMINGFASFIEGVEAIFYSREALSIRAVKLGNAVLAALLALATYTAPFLTKNPVTGLVGAVIGLGVITLSIGKDIFLWYKAREALKTAEAALKAEQNRPEKDPDQVKTLQKTIAKSKALQKKYQKGVGYGIASFIASTLLILGNLLTFGAASLVYQTLAWSLNGVLLSFGIKDMVENISEHAHRKGAEKRAMESEGIELSDLGLSKGHAVILEGLKKNGTGQAVASSVKREEGISEVELESLAKAPVPSEPPPAETKQPPHP